MWLTIPNLLTLVRIVLTPYILVQLARGHYLIAGWTFGAAAWTDVFDGLLARRFGSQSKIGQYLDPIADKILLTSLYIGLALGRAVPVWIVVLILARDVWILLLSGIALRFTGFRRLQPSVWGKASTFFQIMAAVCVIGARAYESAWFLRVSNVLLGGVVVLAVISGLDYSMRGIRYFQRGRTAPPADFPRKSSSESTSGSAPR
jgi:cardiolipin synthase